MLSRFQAWIKARLSRRLAKSELKAKDIKYAFTAGGRDFYTFTDEGKMPAKRYSEYLVKYEEMRMGVNLEFLKHFIGKALDCFTPTATGKNPGILDMTTLHRLIIELKARMELAPIGEDMYAYLSVLFFPLDEDVSRYDPAYNQTKIAEWKKVGIPDFFLIQPIAECLPFMKESPEAILDYLTKQQRELTLLNQAFTTL